MKKTFLIALVASFIFSCSSDNDVNPNCNFLLNVDVNVSINLNLPQFSQLQFPGNSILIPNAGNLGIIVANTGAGIFAWDAADPNRRIEACSRLIPEGLQATSSCEDPTTYELASGQAIGESLPCTLINYRVVQEGNTIFISN